MQGELKFSLKLWASLFAIFIITALFFNKDIEEFEYQSSEKITVEKQLPIIKYTEKEKSNSIVKQNESIYQQEQVKEVVRDSIKKEEEIAKINKAIEDLEDLESNFEERNWESEYLPSDFDFGPTPEIIEPDWIDSIIIEPLPSSDLDSIKIPQPSNYTGAECNSSAGKYLLHCNP